MLPRLRHPRPIHPSHPPPPVLLLRDRPGETSAPNPAKPAARAIGSSRFTVIRPSVALTLLKIKSVNESAKPGAGARRPLAHRAALQHPLDRLVPVPHNAAAARRLPVSS